MLSQNSALTHPLLEESKALLAAPPAAAEMAAEVDFPFAPTPAQAATAAQAVVAAHPVEWEAPDLPMAAAGAAGAVGASPAQTPVQGGAELMASASLCGKLLRGRRE